MFGLSSRASIAPRDYTACSGCSLCFLVCPMWRGSRDPRFTAEGLAKALQSGATASQLAEVIDACSLCGACDPVCPEGIDLSGLVMHLRRQLPCKETLDDLQASLQQGAAAAASVAPRSGVRFLPGPDLRNDAVLLARVQALLGTALAQDDGADIALALEAGVEIPDHRLHQFLVSLRGHGVVAADGLLLRQLRRWLPGSQRMSLGAALSSLAPVRSKITGADLYVIESRAYHADYERMVSYYNRLQMETGCSFNLDLQRLAIPAVAHGLSQKLGLAARDDDAQPRWILRGRKPSRIIVESLADRAAFERVCDVPVLHVADLAEE